MSASFAEGRLRSTTSVGMQSNSSVKRGFRRRNIVSCCDLSARCRNGSVYRGNTALADDDLRRRVDFTCEFEVVAWGWIRIVGGAFGGLVARGCSRALFGPADWLSSLRHCRCGTVDRANSFVAAALPGIVDGDHRLECRGDLGGLVVPGSAG